MDWRSLLIFREIAYLKNLQKTFRNKFRKSKNEKIIAASKQTTVKTVVVNMAEAIASKQIAVPTVVVN